MPIESRYARQAPLVRYHILTAQDTAGDLEVWVTSAYGATVASSPDGNWILDNMDGTFSLWDNGGPGYLTPAFSAGWVLVTYNGVQAMTADLFDNQFTLRSV
jgi:hypothetical protein